MSKAYRSFLSNLGAKLKTVLILSAQPAHAYSSFGAGAWFSSMPVPALVYMLFFLQIGIIRLHTIPTMTVMRVALTAFAGFVVGIFVAVLTTLIFVLFASKVLHAEREPLKFPQLLTCVNFAYGIPLAGEVLSLLFYLIFGWSSVLVTGVLSILMAVALVARLSIVMTQNRTLLMSLYVFAVGLLNVFAMSLPFLADI